MNTNKLGGINPWQNIAEYLTVTNGRGHGIDLRHRSKAVRFIVDGYAISLAAVVSLPYGAYTVAMAMPDKAVVNRVLWQGVDKTYRFLQGWQMTIADPKLSAQWSNLLQIEWSFPRASIIDWSIPGAKPAPHGNLYTIKFNGSPEKEPLLIGNIELLQLQIELLQLQNTVEDSTISA